RAQSGGTHPIRACRCRQRQRGTCRFATRAEERERYTLPACCASAASEEAQRREGLDKPSAGTSRQRFLGELPAAFPPGRESLPRWGTRRLPPRKATTWAERSR